MKVVFWQNMPSHHQAPVIDRLGSRLPGAVRCVWGTPQLEHRRQLGWARPQFQHIREDELPTQFQSAVTRLLSETGDHVHLFSGVWAERPIRYAFARASERRLRVGVIAESLVSCGWKGWLRPVKARLFTWVHGHSIRPFLAMGIAGVRYYERAGLPSDTIYPFMYQVEPPMLPPVPLAVTRTGPLRLLFVGRLTPRKGMHVLLKALSRLRTRGGWLLEVIGEGEQRRALETLAERLGLREHVSWVGSLPSEQIPHRISAADVVVVPSMFDGWGVVVNEALWGQRGCVVSDAAASSELVRSSGAGAVFAAGDDAALSEAISGVLDRPQQPFEWSRRASAFAERMHPDRIAEYLHQVLQHVFGTRSARPQPPWLTGGSTP